MSNKEKDLNSLKEIRETLSSGNTADTLELIDDWIDELETADDVSEVTTHDPEIIRMMTDLERWHASRIEHLEMITSADKDTAVKLQSKDGEEIRLTGAALTGFKSGCALAIEVFSPFPIETEDIPQESDEEE